MNYMKMANDIDVKQTNEKQLKLPNQKSKLLKQNTNKINA